MQKQTTPSTPVRPIGSDHEHAAQERRIILTVGAFFLLAVAMWLTNKYFGPPELQSNLVTSGDFAIGTDQKTYSTASGSTLHVPILVEYPSGQRLSSVRIALAPWPKGAGKPTFVLSSGTSASSTVKMTGSGSVVVTLDSVSLSPSNLGDIGSLEFSVAAGNPSTTIGLISAPSDPDGTMVTSVGLGGKKQEVRLSSAEFFRIESASVPAGIVPSPIAGSGAVVTTRPTGVFQVVNYALPDFSSLIRRFFGVHKQAKPSPSPTASPATGSGSLAGFKSSFAGSGADLHGAAPSGRSPTAPGVDMAVEIQVPKGQVNVGDAFQAKAIVRNDGAARATNVKFSVVVPSELRVIIGSLDRAGCSATGQAVSCTFASMEGGQITSVLIDMRPTAMGNFALQATLKADQTETSTANNQTKATVLAVKAVVASPSPSPLSAPTPTPPSAKPTPAPAGDKLPQTGPLPLGVALMSSGMAVWFLRKRFA